MSLSSMRVASLRVASLRVASLRVASLRVASVRVASLRVASLRIYRWDLLPRKCSLKWKFVCFWRIDLIFYTLTDLFILRNALVSLFRIFKILAGKWRNPFGGNILFKCFKTSLVNFSKVRCCVNFKTESIIELSWFDQEL
jgi:hypothetical protein